MNSFIPKKSSHYLYLTFLIALLILLFFFIRQERREDYYNYFLPYYSANSSDAYNFYQKNEDEYNQTKKSFLYQPVRIGLHPIPDMSQMMKQLGSMFVAKSNIQKVFYIQRNSEKELIEACNQRNIDIINCANPLISNAYTFKDAKNLRFICNTNKMYFYIMSNRASKIESLSDISKYANASFTIAVDEKESVSELFCKDIMSLMDYQEGRDYQIIYSKDGLKALSEEKAQIVIYALPYHPQLFQERCCAVNTEIFFLPFDLTSHKKSLFFTKNFYYIPDFYDLNDICPSYLPKKYGGKTYTRFSAQIPIVSYYHTLVCHDRFDDKRTKEILRTFYENIALFNQLPIFHKAPLYRTQLNGGPQNALPINHGAKQFFMEKGYITMSDNESCKYLVGVEACNKTSLEKHGFEEDGKVLDSIFRIR